MVRTVGRNWWAVAAAMLTVASACEDPQSPASHVQALLTDGGSLAVDVNTTFAVPDASSMGSIPPGGFTVWVDASASQSVGTNGVVTFNGLAAGNHEVALYGIPFNCTVSTPNKGPNDPQGFSLIAGMGASTNFSLGCGSWGGLFVSINTTGVDLPGGGYTVTVDGGAGQQVAANGNVTFTQLYVTSHSVALSGVAGNCTLSGPNTQQFTVSAGQITSLTFSASCAPVGTGNGTLTVTTPTTGSNVPAGYTVTVDGTSSQAIAINGSATFTVPAGANPVMLSGVASNCTVAGGDTSTVTVTAGGTDTTTLAVTCAAPVARVTGTGQLGMGTATPHNGVQTFDFDVRADLTGRFTITAYDDIHPDGTIATVFTDPSRDAATSIKAYRTSSSACSDPSHGAEFDALGRDGPDLVPYTVIVCDEGPQGSGRDFLSFFIFKPDASGAGRSGIVTSGDVVKQ
ncbi:MAG TPA: hypothetical protein VGV12_01440 [Gemmatimonadales bacterium]|nr:hypothetical protein [Gemmatimonadales bacterium]